MEDVLVLKRTGILRDRDPEKNVNGNKTSQSRTDLGSSTLTLLAECGINFFAYLRSLNLSNETDILVLPPNHHYYYDGKELRSIRVLINLKKLNLIKHLDVFLNTLVRILPQNTNFIGCFSDSEPAEGEGTQFNLSSKLFRRFINLFDSGTDHGMNKKKVTRLLEKNGFETVDMKEMQGLTYFNCRASINKFN